VNNLSTVITLLIGTGGVGAITVLVKNWRTIRSGQLDDEESLLVRVHKQLQLHDESRQRAEERAEAEARLRQKWREQAWTYRIQLLSTQVPPNDLPVMKDDLE